MRQVYSFVFFLLLPALVLRLLLRSLASPEYRRRLGERFGKVSAVNAESTAGSCEGVIWIHTVSVGEFIAAEPLIQRLQAEYQRPILVTCTTPTGSERIMAAFGDSVYHQYLPYDLGVFLKPLFEHYKPVLIVVMETELWPNFLSQARKNNVPSLLANGRLSEHSMRGYKKVSGLTKHILNDMSFFSVQSEQDKNNFLSLGLDESKVAVSGSIKFDVQINENMLEAGSNLRSLLGLKRRVWIAASTHEGEDEIALQVHEQLKQQFPDLLLIIVPRHPERFNSVAKLIQEKGFKYYRRSTGSLGKDCEVFLGDTMGEMMLFYGMADIAFVGGSMVDNGGHNILEPAVLGLPIITGTFTYNFKWVMDEFFQDNAVKVVGSQNELKNMLRDLLQDSEAVATLSWAAMNVIEKNRGAMDRLIGQIRDMLAA